MYIHAFLEIWAHLRNSYWANSLICTTTKAFCYGLLQPSRLCRPIVLITNVTGSRVSRTTNAYCSKQVLLVFREIVQTGTGDGDGDDIISQSINNIFSRASARWRCIFPSFILNEHGTTYLTSVTPLSELGKQKEAEHRAGI